jgi:hypothetical protein
MLVSFLSRKILDDHRRIRLKVTLCRNTEVAMTRNQTKACPSTDATALFRHLIEAKNELPKSRGFTDPKF